jgi:hypothetical protein
MGNYDAEVHRRSWLKVKYGLTEEDYQKLFRKQRGRCCICQKRLGSRTAVDHDHETGFVRGLLCLRCNTGLGLFEDNIRLLAAAIVYLQDAEEAQTKKRD